MNLTFKKAFNYAYFSHFGIFEFWFIRDYQRCIFFWHKNHFIAMENQIFPVKFYICEIQSNKKIMFWKEDFLDFPSYTKTLKMQTLLSKEEILKEFPHKLEIW